jgi:glycosyltransferase involved in cell wall biosynthesis
MKIGWIRYPKILYSSGKVAKGGSEIANQNIIDYLREQGCEVVEFSPVSKERIDLIDLPALGTPLMFQELIEKKEELNQCDLILTTNWFGAILPEIKKPLITIFHHNAAWLMDTIAESKIENLQNFNKWLAIAKKYSIGGKSFQQEHEKVISLGEQYFVMRSNRIISVGGLLKQTLLKYYNAESQKISVIYNALPESWFKNPKKEFKTNQLKVISVTRLPSDRNGFIVKGADRLFEIFSKSPGKILLIISGTSKKYRDLVKDNFKDVQFHQNLDQQKIQKAYLDSHIALMVARCESFGLAIIEAMATKTVPIVFPTGVAREFIKDGANGFIVNNIEEVLDRINYLQGNPEIAEKMADKAYRTVLEKVSIEMIGKAYLKLFNEVAKGDKGKLLK